jgi:ankyrin repeat protein
MVQLLIEHGAAINAPPGCYDGGTALQKAALGRAVELVDFLLLSGADINAPAAPGRGHTALQAAAKSGHAKIVTTLLKAGADITEPAAERGGSAIELAAENGRLDILQILLDSHPKNEDLASQCERAAVRAETNSHFAVAKVLREYRKE